MRRGEVWWATMGQKIRPVVLVSRDSHVQTRSMVLVSPVTTRVRRIESEVALGPDDGLPKACVANTSSIELITKARIIRKVAALSIAKVEALDSALRFSLGLD